MVTEPEILSLISGTHMVKGEDPSPAQHLLQRTQLSPDFTMHPASCAYPHMPNSNKMQSIGTREVAQQLRAHIVLPEYRRSIASTSTESITPASMATSVPCRQAHVHVTYAYMEHPHRHNYRFDK